MFFRNKKDCLNDLIFITMISLLIYAASYFMVLFPFDHYGILAFFISVSYIVGFNDGRDNPWN